MAAASDTTPKLVEAWQQIQARISERQSSQRQGTSKSFVEYAWDEFDPREIANILATPGESYFAHKDILYEGYCAWVASPKSARLPRHGMVLRTALHLDAAEQFGRDKFGGIGQIGDIYIRTNLIGSEFFEEIYYPIGGILRIARSLSRAGYRARLREQSKGIQYGLRVLEIYHHHVEHLLDQKHFGKPSLNTAAGLVSEIDVSGDKLPGERAIKEYWSQHRVSIAFGYAAQSIKVNEDKTLLDLILTGATSWRKHRTLFPAWMARTRFVVDHVLSQCAETDTASGTMGLLPEIEPEPFAGVQFDARQAENIARKFNRKR
ncbi:hypothetical protein MBRA_03906 [Methylobacterium brachiatum]|nr:hypothetical protein MBRA_03906 [Methylobacterium brachiatum]